MNQRQQAPLICGGHSRPIPDIRYSPITEDGVFLISACLDGKPMLRNGETGDWIGTFEGHKGAVWSACLNTPATKAITGSADFTVKLWDSLSGEEIHSFKHGHIVKTVDFAQDGERILTGGHEKSIRIFDLNKIEAEAVRLESVSNIIKVAIWGGPTHGDNVILGGLQSESGIFVWDVRTGTRVKTLPTSGPVSSLEPCLDGKHLASASGKEAQFWDMEKLELVKSFSCAVPVESATLHPDHTKFVAGCSDNWVHVYDFKSGAEQEVLKGHHGPVHCVRISPSTDSFASGSEDGTIRIWATTPVKAEANGVTPQPSEGATDAA